MQSRNPILNNSDTFNGRSAAQYGDQGYPAGGRAYQGYGAPSTAPQGSDPSTWQYPTDQAMQERMTIDSVVMRTAMTLGLVVLTGALTWIFLPDGANGGTDLVGVAWIGGALVGAGLGLVLSFQRVVSPALVMLYAIAEGFFLGAASEAFERVYSGIVIQAVTGTVAAFIATLAAYKFFNIQVTSTFRKWVTIVGMGFLVVVFGDFLLSMFHASLGFNGFGPLGLIMSFVGLGLGVLYLILDFDMVEKGIAAGAPEVESWRAAFALTAALVLIYVELLRILAILRGE